MYCKRKIYSVWRAIFCTNKQLLLALVHNTISNKLPPQSNINAGGNKLQCHETYKTTEQVHADCFDVHIEQNSKPCYGIQQLIRDLVATIIKYFHSMILCNPKAIMLQESFKGDFPQYLTTQHQGTAHWVFLTISTVYHCLTRFLTRSINTKLSTLNHRIWPTVSNIEHESCKLHCFSWLDLTRRLSRKDISPPLALFFMRMTSCLVGRRTGSLTVW